MLRSRSKSSAISNARPADNSPGLLKSCGRNTIRGCASFSGIFRSQLTSTLVKPHWRPKLRASRGNFGRCTTPCIESYAGTIGVNLDQFKKDVDSDKVRQRVDSDEALADSLGIKVTPTLFINNRPVDSKDKNPEGIRAEINAALQEKSKSGT
jgi:Thioredoxin